MRALYTFFPTFCFTLPLSCKGATSHVDLESADIQVLSGYSMALYIFLGLGSKAEMVAYTDVQGPEWPFFHASMQYLMLLYVIQLGHAL